MSLRQVSSVVSLEGTLSQLQSRAYGETPNEKKAAKTVEDIRFLLLDKVPFLDEQLSAEARKLAKESREFAGQSLSETLKVETGDFVSFTVRVDPATGSQPVEFYLDSLIIDLHRVFRFGVRVLCLDLLGEDEDSTGSFVAVFTSNGEEGELTHLYEKIQEINPEVCDAIERLAPALARLDTKRVNLAHKSIKLGFEHVEMGTEIEVSKEGEIERIDSDGLDDPVLVVEGEDLGSHLSSFREPVEAFVQHLPDLVD